MDNQPKQDKTPPTLIRKGEKSESSSIRKSENFTFYGVTKTQAGNAPTSLALKVIFKDGSQKSIHYHEITSPLGYDGGQEVKFETPTLSIRIVGSDLQNLYDYIIEHRVVWIKEPDTDFIEAIKGKSEVESIEVKEKG